eukprot:4927240-Prymnesium_polylepis.1
MADVVYEPSLVEPLLKTVLALSHRKTVILLAYDTAHGRWDAYGALAQHAKRWFEWHDLRVDIKDTVRLVRLVVLADDGESGGAGSGHA